VIRLIRAYSERDEKGYVVESLWKFLLYSEIAIAAAAEITKRPYGVPRDSAEWALVKYLDDAEFLTQDFGVRLERTVEQLLTAPSAGGIATRRAAISEALHGGVIGELRRLLTRAVQSKLRIAVLVDNLDRAWDRTEDLGELALFLLGLLSVVEEMDAEFMRQAERGEGAPLTLAVFIRSDIYRHVARVAQEPDKLPTTRLEWRDRELLLRVVEERYLATREHVAEPEELWQKYFCPEVRRIPTRYYIAERVLPRPRDIVYLCNAAITAAVNRRRARIEEEDILAAETLYSEFAFEALLVEDVGEFGDLELIVLAFAGQQAILSLEEVNEALTQTDVQKDDITTVRNHLRSLGFLGVEVAPNRFDYSDEARDMRRADALATRLGREHGEEPRFAVHPAFRAFLEMYEPEWHYDQLSLGRDEV